MAERLANLGYFALKKEATKGTPVTPNVYVPIYKETLQTAANLVEDNPVVGIKYKTYQIVPGQRSHKGEVTIMAEPNSVGYVFDMLLNKVSDSGTNPATHSFALNTTNPNSYTVDINTGNVVNRFWGVESASISPSFDKNEMRLQCQLSALGSFQGRQLTSNAAGTLVLDTTYDQNPTTGLVAGDLVRIFLANGTTVDTTVTSITNGTTVVVASGGTATAGDFICLRPATPSLSLLTPFLWSNTQFCFGATAAAALSAAQLRVETGSAWSVAHNFENADGAMRSGGFDPAALVRTQGEVTLKVTKFFDTPGDLQNFNQLTKTACVVRHYVYAGGNTYELRITFNHLKTDGKVKPEIESGKVNYSELDFKPQQDATDAQAFDVKVINAIATI